PVPVKVPWLPLCRIPETNSSSAKTPEHGLGRGRSRERDAGGKRRPPQGECDQGDEKAGTGEEGRASWRRGRHGDDPEMSALRVRPERAACPDSRGLECGEPAGLGAGG